MQGEPSGGSMIHAVFLTRSPEFGGSNAELFFERLVDMGFILVPAQLGNLLEGQKGLVNQRLLSGLFC